MQNGNKLDGKKSQTSEVWFVGNVEQISNCLNKTELDSWNQLLDCRLLDKSCDCNLSMNDGGSISLDASCRLTIFNLCNRTHYPS